MKVYIIKNQVNGKMYIGQTISRLSTRLSQHIAAAKYNQRQKRYISILGNAILKYGPDSFSIELLEECSTREELDAAEQKWISHYNSYSPTGYNIRSGGQHSPVSIETRRKLAAVVHSPERRLRSSIAHMGIRASDTACKALDAGRKLRHINGQRPSGELNPRAKLTKGAVAEIKQMAEQKIPQKIIAQQFGVSQAAVSAIICGQTWICP